MSAPEHHEVAQLLLQKAREDLSAAQVLELPQVVLAADWLTPRGVLFRYDDDPTVSLDRDRALDAATAAIGFAEQTLGN